MLTATLNILTVFGLPLLILWRMVKGDRDMKTEKNVKFARAANGRFAICPKCGKTTARNACGYWNCIKGCGYEFKTNP